MGRDRDQREYVQEVTSADLSYRVIIKAKSKVKRDNPAIASLSQGISKTFASSCGPSGYRRDYRVLVFV